MTTRWLGSAPSVCDLCGTPIVDVFYDVSIPRLGGQWANVDHRCFTDNGASLGVGRGQKYIKQGEHFMCVEGSQWDNTAAESDGK